jgi:hypothetical protein
MRSIIPFTLLLITFGLWTGCASLRNYNTVDAFEKASVRYNEMLRWRDMYNAGLTFGSAVDRERFIKRAKDAEGVLITEYRVKSQECLPDKNEARLVVAIDYYIPPSITVKTLDYEQLWKFSDEDGKKRWIILTPPPEFK